MNDQPRWKIVLTMVTLWFTTFSVMCQLVTTVILNDLYVAFPSSEFYITSALSWTLIMIALSGIVGGWILKFISAKAELVIAAVLILVGVIPRFIQTPEFILVFALIQGIGAGFSNTAGMAMVSKMFPDEIKRSKQMGYYNFVMAAVGALMTLAGGILAVNGWQFAYDIYWVALPMLIMTCIFLPNDKKFSQDENADTAQGENGSANDGGKRYISRLVLFFVSCFVWFFVWQLQQGFISVYLSETGIGDVSFAGVCTSFTTLGSAVACVLFGFFYPHLRRKITCVTSVLTAASLLMLWAFPCVPVSIVCSVVGGACCGTMLTVIYAYAGSCVPAKGNGMTMGLMTLDYSLAQGIGVYAWAFVIEVTGGIGSSLLMGAVLLAVILVIEIGASIHDDKAGFLKTAK